MENEIEVHGWLGLGSDFRTPVQPSSSAEVAKHSEGLVTQVTVVKEYPQTNDQQSIALQAVGLGLLLLTGVLIFFRAGKKSSASK